MSWLHVKYEDFHLRARLRRQIAWLSRSDRRKVLLQIGYRARTVCSYPGTQDTKQIKLALDVDYVYVPAYTGGDAPLDLRLRLVF